MDDEITKMAFSIHLLGGQAHMFGKKTIFNPILIFEDQCPCIRRAIARINEIRINRIKLEEKDFSRLFEPRINEDVHVIQSQGAGDDRGSADPLFTAIENRQEA